MTLTWRFQTRQLPEYGARELLRVLPPGPACLLDGLQCEGRRVQLVAWHPRWRMAGCVEESSVARLQQAAGSEPLTGAAGLLTSCCALLGYGLYGGEPGSGDLDVPTGAWGFQPRCAALFDTKGGKLHLASADDAARLMLAAALEQVEDAPPLPENVPELHARDVTASLDRGAYMAAITAAQAEMAAGRLQKVVLASRFTVPAQVQPLVVLERLAHAQPLLLYCYREEEFTLVGAAPEWLVGRAGAQVWMHPLAGTRPLAGSSLPARRLELLTSPKDVGEHLRALELCSADLAPLCEPESLRVVRKLVVEKHGPLCHLASRVEGELLPGVDSAQVVGGCFPSGTVAGVPRAAAMACIQAHEPVARGLYAGAVGTFLPGGDLQLFLPLRSVCFSRGLAHVYAGAGVMPDSDPAAEFQEICHKASGGLRALGVVDWLAGGGPHGS